MKVQATTKDLLNAAALQTMERIRSDHERVPPRLKPMLAYIESHLFDSRLNVNRLKEACGIRDNSVAIHFHAAVGRPPHAYISHCRLETAARLLRDTEMPIWKISEVLGFSSIQVFSRSFCRWAKKRPTVFRREARKRAEGHRERQSMASRVHTDDYWRRAMSGHLEDEEAAELIQKLLRLYPPGRRKTA